MNTIQNDKKKFMVIKDREIKDFFMKELSKYVKKNNITCDGKTYYIFFEQMSVIISRTKNLKEKNSLNPYTEKTFSLRTFLDNHGFVEDDLARNYMRRINKTDEYDDDHSSRHSWSSRDTYYGILSSISRREKKGKKRPTIKNSIETIDDDDYVLVNDQIEKPIDKIEKPIDEWYIYDYIEEVYKDDVKIWFHKDINKIIEDFIDDHYKDVVVYI